jgi:hypothetical protein
VPYPEVARVAASKTAVEYKVLNPATDAVAALERDAPQLRPGGNLVCLGAAKSSS